MATTTATPLLRAPSTEPTTRLEMNTTNPPTISNMAGLYDQTRPGPTQKPRPRKLGGGGGGSKSQQAKKQPQRGMGVAQLERLRKMAEMPPQYPYFSSAPPPDIHLFAHSCPPDSIALAGRGVYGANLLASPAVMAGPGLVMGRGIFAPWSTSSPGDGIPGGDHIRAPPTAPVVVPGRVVFGAPGAPNGNGSMMETWGELSSIPNARQCVSDLCDICIKKKRTDAQNVIGVDHRGGAGRESLYVVPPEKIRVLTMSSNRNGDLLGLSNVENHACINGGFSSSRAPAAPIFNLDDDQDVEVMAIHSREGGGGGGGGGVFIEYEFFPGKKGRGAATEGLSISAEGQGSASAFASGPVGEASHSIDLSLKLSY